MAGLREVTIRAGPSARRVALALSVATVGLAAGAAASATPTVDPRPNVLLVVTDDQSWDSLDGSPAAMPWLARQLADPARGWIRFTDAVAVTPVCCPSRATILTGRPAWETGVVRNVDGERLDASTTVAAALHDAGYVTGLVGKYLNGYPWGRPPFVPRGWDRWVAKRNLAATTTYASFPAIDQTSPVWVGPTPKGYATDWLAARARAFVRTAPRGRPWFLVFSPSAPHPPFVPAGR